MMTSLRATLETRVLGLGEGGLFGRDGQQWSSPLTSGQMLVGRVFWKDPHPPRVVGWQGRTLHLHAGWPSTLGVLAHLGSPRRVACDRIHVSAQLPSRPATSRITGHPLPTGPFPVPDDRLATSATNQLQSPALDWGSHHGTHFCLALPGLAWPPSPGPRWSGYPTGESSRRASPRSSVGIMGPTNSADTIREKDG